MDSVVITLDDTPASPTEPDIEILREEIHNRRDSDTSQHELEQPSFSNMRVRVELEEGQNDGEQGIGFMLDRCGLRLPNPLFNPDVASASPEPKDNRQKNIFLSEAIPKYDVESSAVIDVHADEESEEESLGGLCKNLNQAKKAQTCFNCGGAHMINDCTTPKDPARISKNIRMFKRNNNTDQKNCRYHEDIDQKYAKFQPGKLSESLREALGLSQRQLGKHIYNMRIYGYPPGWKAKALEQTTTLRLYGYNIGIEQHRTSKDCLDRTQVYHYPGFNSPLPEGFLDECRQLNKPPFNREHSVELFIDKLSKEYREKQVESNRKADATRHANFDESPPPPGTEMGVSESVSRSQKAMMPQLKPISPHDANSPISYSLGRGHNLRREGAISPGLPFHEYYRSGKVDVRQNLRRDGAVSPGLPFHEYYRSGKVDIRYERRRWPKEIESGTVGEDPYADSKRHQSQSQTSSHGCVQRSFHDDRPTTSRSGREEIRGRRDTPYGHSSSKNDGRSNSHRSSNNRNSFDTWRPTNSDKSSRSDRQSHRNDYHENSDRRHNDGRRKSNQQSGSETVIPDNNKKGNNSPLAQDKNLDGLQYLKHLEKLGQASPIKKKEDDMVDKGYGPQEASNVTFRTRTPSPSLIDTAHLKDNDCSGGGVNLSSDDEVMIISPSPSPPPSKISNSNKPLTSDLIQSPEPSDATPAPKDKNKRKRKKAAKKKEENWEEHGELDQDSSLGSEDSDTDDEDVILEGQITADASKGHKVNDGGNSATSKPPIISLEDDNSDPIVDNDVISVSDDEEVGLLIDDDVIIENPLEPVVPVIDKSRKRTLANDVKLMGPSPAKRINVEESQEGTEKEIISLSEGKDPPKVKTLLINPSSNTTEELLAMPPVYVYKNSYENLPSLDKFSVGMGDLLFHETNEEHKGRFDKVLKVLQKRVPQ